MILSTIFRKKKLTTDKVANVFVNSLTSSIDNSFEDITNSIINSPEFIKKPNIDHNNSDKFLMIILAGNISYLKRYFTATEEKEIKGKIIEKFAGVFGLDYKEMKSIIDDFSAFICRVNYPSKNTIYGMSKALFFKYNLGESQEEYFAKLNTPNPLLLKQLDKIVENYIWDWTTFFNTYKITH
jgi:hypothetical protein